MKTISFILFGFFILQRLSFVHAQILVDHKSISDFDRIPLEYKKIAENTRLIFMDRSVGANISQYLDCLASDWGSSRSYCKRYEHRDSAYKVDPKEVQWNGAWNRNLWRYETWPTGCSEDVTCFLNTLTGRLDSFDVLGCQFSYLAVTPGSKIADPINGFFGSKISSNHASVLDKFEKDHSDKKIIWWTSSLARGIGTPESMEFNHQMREYCQSHQKILFDVADIESHAPDGSPCYDNRDGIQYLDENNPDDSLDIPAICPQYTTETEGGHLGSISAGGVRIAKAFWVLIARMFGWNPLTNIDETNVLDSDFVIHPNPADQYIEVYLKLKDSDHATFRLYNLEGKPILVNKIFPGNNRLNLTEIPSGLYYVLINQKGKKLLIR